MSRNGTLLPIPADPITPERMMMTPETWAAYQERYGVHFPRSKWLRDFEVLLSVRFPTASSADRRLTARHAAPFPLRDGPNVP
jgi:hypothetical protein